MGTGRQITSDGPEGKSPEVWIVLPIASESGPIAEHGLGRGGASLLLGRGGAALLLLLGGLRRGLRHDLLQEVAAFCLSFPWSEASQANAAALGPVLVSYWSDHSDAMLSIALALRASSPFCDISGAEEFRLPVLVRRCILYLAQQAGN
jgi:hypothetical protein